MLAETIRDLKPAPMRETAPRTDADIGEEITRMMATDVWLDGGYIATQVKEGVSDPDR